MLNKITSTMCLSLVLLAGELADLCGQSTEKEPGEEQTVIDQTRSSQDRESISSSVDTLVGTLFSARNRMGFAFSLSEFYSPDRLTATTTQPGSLTSGTIRQGGAFTAATSTIYGNFQRAKSNFHFDYTLGYQRDNQQSNLNGVTHGGSLSWSRMLGRRATLGVSDSLTVGANDYGTSNPWSAYQIQQPYVLTQEVFVRRQRVTRNSLTVSTGFQLAKHTNLNLFVTDDYVQYQIAAYGNSHAAQAGFNLSHQLSKFMFVETSYTTFISRVNRFHHGTSIQRLRALTFRFNRRGLSVSSSGGVAYAHNSGSHNVVADIEATLTAGSPSTLFTLRYNHGLTSILGAGAAFETDTFYGQFLHRISNRFSVDVNSNYVRTPSSPNQNYDSLYAGAGVQFAVTPDFILSAHHNYMLQQANTLGVDALHLHRNMVSGSIYYMLPPFRVR
jgi:hypothetical protein